MVELPYSFRYFENVPVKYLSDSDLEKAIAMDLIIPVAKEIQETYEMSNVVDEVVRRNQEAINLMNNSSSDDDLYPQANDFNGNDDDYLDQLHNMMDQEGDVAHDRDWEDKPSFANNTPENRWRDLRSLADSTFTDHEMEEVVKRKSNNNPVEHDLQAIQKGINDSYDYISVNLVGSQPDEGQEDGVDTPEDKTDPENGGQEGSGSQNLSNKEIALIVAMLIGLLWWST